MRFLDKLFGRKTSTFSGPDGENWGAFFAAKITMFEQLLGPAAPIVGHSIVPFQMGGTVDMYYFPNAVPGTGFVTAEVVGINGRGPAKGPLACYELIAFTRLPFDQEETPEFSAINDRLTVIFTSLVDHSRRAVLKPYETAEIPGEDGVGTSFLVFDEFSKPGVALELEGRPYRLLLVIEVPGSEMDYARKNGAKALIEKLQAAGHYPYSDLDREPVA